jgi:hypothetical protein
MLEPSVPPIMMIAAMPWHEQQRCRKGLLRAPGLHARWRMRRTVVVYSSGAQSQFSEHLLAGHVTGFEIVFAYAGLHREVSCCYTIREAGGLVLCEAPLRIPHVRFTEDGQEAHLVHGASAWQIMHRHFHLRLMPFLLLGYAIG